MKNENKRNNNKNNNNTIDTICKWHPRCSHLRIGVGTEGRLNERTSGYHPYYSIVKVGLNTKKSPGDLRCAVNQSPAENHQVTLA